MYVKNFFSVKHMARYSQSRCAENFFVVLKIFFLFLRSRPVVGVFWLMILYLSQLRTLLVMFLDVLLHVDNPYWNPGVG